MSKFKVMKPLVAMQALWAGFFSFMHIYAVAHTFGMGWQSWVVPLVIDGMAVLGMLGRDHAAREVRRMATTMMLMAGAASLACNVYAGENWFQQAWGVAVVAFFVGAESYLTVLLRHGNGTQDVAKSAKSAANRERALKGAATRKANRERDARLLAKTKREMRKSERVAAAA